MSFTVADPGFSWAEGGANSQSWCADLFFGLKTAWKWNNLNPQGWHFVVHNCLKKIINSLKTARNYIINNIITEINDKRPFPVHEQSWYSSNSFAKKRQKVSVRRPGVEPGLIAWKATMLTVTPPTPSCSSEYMNKIVWFLDHDLHGTAHCMHFCRGSWGFVFQCWQRQCL